MTDEELAQRVRIAYDRCSDLREHANRDGSFSIAGDKMMALIELRNLALDVETALLKR